MTGGREGEGDEGENDVVAAEEDARQDACCCCCSISSPSSSSAAASASSCSLSKAGGLVRSTLPPPRSIGLMELSRVCSSSSFFWNALGRQSRRGARAEDEEAADEEDGEAADADAAADDVGAETPSLPVGAAFVAAETKVRARSAGQGRRGTRRAPPGPVLAVLAVVEFVVADDDEARTTADDAAAPATMLAAPSKRAVSFSL